MTRRFPPCRPAQTGFTLLELLVALAILAIAFTVIWSTFSAGVTAWQRGGQLLDNMRHADFVAEQLVSALRSAAYFPSRPEKYGFRLKTRSLRYPADRISWVTSSSAFMPPDSPWRHALHRIVFTIENNDRGEPAVAIRALTHLTEEEDADEMDVEPWFVSSDVVGFRCRFYDFEKDSWSSDWEDTNSIPSLVEITLYMEPLEKYDPPITIKRLVVIPVAPAITNAVKPDSSSEPNAGAGGQTAAGARARRGARGHKELRLEVR